IWWASPAGMFAWLVIGFAVIGWLRGRVPAPAPRVAAAAIAVGTVAVATVGALVAARQKHDRLENAFDPARAIVDRVRAEAPQTGTVFVTGDRDEVAVDL